MAKLTISGAEDSEEDAAGTTELSFSQNSDCKKKFRAFRPRDVLLSSYPKCDSKIVDIIVWKLLYPLSNLPPRNNMTNRYLIPIEMQDGVFPKNSPRILKTYLPFHQLPFHKRSKYIYVLRSPWKACISYYKFLKLTQAISESFEEFFQLFLEGELGYGCYFKHISPWIKRLEESNVLVLRHEHVKSNPRSAVFMIAAFLGECHLNRILQSEDILDGICAEKLRLPPTRRHVSVEEMPPCKLQCSEKQIQDLVKKISEETEGTCVQYLWLSILKNRVINRRTI
nr:sulfotransferase 1C4 [Parasteatoda tepidariorum]